MPLVKTKVSWTIPVFPIFYSSLPLMLHFKKLRMVVCLSHGKSCISETEIFFRVFFSQMDITSGLVLSICASNYFCHICNLTTKTKSSSKHFCSFLFIDKYARATNHTSLSCKQLIDNFSFQLFPWIHQPQSFFWIIALKMNEITIGLM